MKVERPIDLHPLAERIILGLIPDGEALRQVAVLAPGKTVADVNVALDCSKKNGGGGNFSYEHVLAAVAERLYNGGVFVETFVEADD